jgi:Rrf2 family protein
MMLSRSSAAAVTAMGVLANSHAAGEGPITAAEIARRSGIPAPFVAKLLVVLSRHGLVGGSRGRHGGYWLEQSLDRLSLADVTACFERAAKLEDCPVGIGRCGAKPACSLHSRLAPVRTALRDFLEQTTLADMVDGPAAPKRPRRRRS